MNFTLKSIVIIAALFSVSLGEGMQWVKTFHFKDAKPIIMKDQLLHQYGIADDAKKALRVVYLHDLVNMHGHLCPGVMSAYLIPIIVIEKLYVKGEIPNVGDIKMTTPSYDGLYEEVASALRLEKDSHHGPQTWFKGDKNGNSEVLTFVFERISNSAMLKVTFDKTAFMKKHVDMKAYRMLKSKVMAGKASKKEKDKFVITLRKLMEDMYKNRESIYKTEVVRR